jgi:uncharacterized protein (DUF488 family)
MATRRHSAGRTKAAADAGGAANPIYTVGHSNHNIERFLALLRGARVTLVVDVRTLPASRRFPQFHRAALTAALSDAGIGYLWLGDALGGRPQKADGSAPAADYEQMASQPQFARGLARVLELSGKQFPALMCAEREPLDCHRVVLVGRHLARQGAELRHILADGNIEPHAALEDRLLELHGYDDGDLLTSTLPRAERVERAWTDRGRHMTRPR